MHGRSRFFLEIALAFAACLIVAMGLPVLQAAPAARTSTAAKSAAPNFETKGSAIDVNTADAEKLTELPGIGEALARRIVEYRKEHGPFKSIDDLLNVRGIGERMLDKLRDRVSVGTKE